ncbi:hypothetical protein WSM22_30140 [Cytophagales bacterium WSM2-2]|nr:hypothetical protein WSM22_30140 [Cytophagales bacterium WSM2-2]
MELTISCSAARNRTEKMISNGADPEFEIVPVIVSTAVAPKKIPMGVSLNFIDRKVNMAIET